MAKIIYVADIYCPWCYAFAPIMQKLVANFPEFTISVIGGNLISRPMTLEEDVAKQPDLVDFWHEVERVSGRSLEGAINAVKTGREIRMYSPGADEIFNVLKSMKPGKELEQFIYLEDFFYGKGIDLFSLEILAQIAKDWKINTRQFEKALDQPKALAMTEKTLAEAAELMGEISSYPSVILTRGNKFDPVSRGYVHYVTVEARLKDAMQDLGIELTDAVAKCSTKNGCTSGRHNLPKEEK